MSDANHLQNVLRSLLPVPVSVVLSASLPADARLMTTELAFTPNMVAKRLSEFTHGRHCARAAMTQLGLPPQPIPVGPNREPLWPAAMVGSITHSGHVAAAAAASINALRGIGIDIEKSEPLDTNIIGLIQREDETDWRSGEEAKALFSIKESIYKCIYPLLGRFVDFREMRVSRNTEGEYIAEPQFATHAAIPDRFTGRYHIGDVYILSSAWINQTSNPAA
jgi:4'-phosphopantetheinyl transferase EntD